LIPLGVVADSLYLFLSDMKAGDVTGQGVNAFGAMWYAMSPSIEGAAAVP
jgi:predicted lipoprotein with Yx(FWY)xxD motif